MSKYNISNPQSMNFFSPQPTSNYTRNPNELEGVDTTSYSPMLGNVTERELYPIESGSVNPYLSYAKGGRINLPSLASLLEQKGRGGDTILAHINPLEAKLLKGIGGSGDINPDTGLKQFIMDPISILSLISSLGGTAATLLGGDDEDERKEREEKEEDYLPSLESLLSSGEDLSDHEKIRRKMRKQLTGNNFAKGGRVYDKLTGKFVNIKEPPSFMEKVQSKTSDYFSNPATWVNLAGTAAQYLKDKPKTKERVKEKEKISPLERAMDIKMFNEAMKLSPSEIKNEAIYRQMLDEAAWRNQNNLAEGETMDLPPLYRKQFDEEEAKKKGRLLGYYNNPDFSGAEVFMSKGGTIDLVGILEEMFGDSMLDEHKREHHRNGIDNEEDGIDITMIIKSDGNNYDDEGGEYIDGDDNGQDDTIPAMLSDGEYVLDAPTVSDIGDGNNKAGAKKLDEFRKRIRIEKRGNSKLPKKIKPLETYIR